MKTQIDFLEVDFIGGLGSLTKEDELKLNEYFKSRKNSKLKKVSVKNTFNSVKQKL